MIVIGFDPHQRVHTATAVDAGTNRGWPQWRSKPCWPVTRGCGVGQAVRWPHWGLRPTSSAKPGGSAAIQATGLSAAGRWTGYWSVRRSHRLCSTTCVCKSGCHLAARLPLPAHRWSMPPPSSPDRLASKRGGVMVVSSAGCRCDADASAMRCCRPRRALTRSSVADRLPAGGQVEGKRRVACQRNRCVGVFEREVRAQRGVRARDDNDVAVVTNCLVHPGR
jgi:hypothetical protein